MRFRVGDLVRFKSPSMDSRWGLQKIIDTEKDKVWVADLNGENPAPIFPTSLRHDKLTVLKKFYDEVQARRCSSFFG